MGKVNKLLLMISTFIMAFIIETKGVNAADWTCNYITSDSKATFSIDIKNNKIADVIACGSDSSVKIFGTCITSGNLLWAYYKYNVDNKNSFLKTDIKNFITTEGKSGCPNIYYSYEAVGNTRNYILSITDDVKLNESWVCDGTIVGNAVEGFLNGGVIGNSFGSTVVNTISKCGEGLKSIRIASTNLGAEIGMPGILFPPPPIPEPEPMPEGSCGFIGPNTLKIIEWIIKIIRIVIPVLIIFLGIVDFANAMFSGEDKTLKECGTRFIKRLMAAIILIFLPYILSILINISGIAGDYDINPDNMFCAFF